MPHQNPQQWWIGAYTNTNGVRRWVPLSLDPQTGAVRTIAYSALPPPLPRSRRQPFTPTPNLPSVDWRSLPPPSPASASAEPPEPPLPNVPVDLTTDPAVPANQVITKFVPQQLREVR
jgi:hypothetical protein